MNSSGRAEARALQPARCMRYLTELGGDEIAVRQQAAEMAIRAMGITFTVYHEQDGSIDRAWPLDIIPRTISRKEWQRIEKGLIQRAAALNLFIDDIYHEQKFIRDGRMPAEIIHTSKNFRACVQGHQSAAGHLGAHLRLGPDPRQGRHGVRARGQPARSLGRVVHAREPAGHQARVSGTVRELRHPAGGRLSLAAVRHAAPRCRRARWSGPKSWC